MQVWFAQGEVRTWPNEWFGWSGRDGFALYVAVALPLLAVLVMLTRREVRRGSA